MPFLYWGSVPGAAKQGFRSLFAFWMGGATHEAVTASAGVKSMFAFWMGGATSRSSGGGTPTEIHNRHFIADVGRMMCR